MQLFLVVLLVFAQAYNLQELEQNARLKRLNKALIKTLQEVAIGSSAPNYLDATTGRCRNPGASAGKYVSYFEVTPISPSADQPACREVCTALPNCIAYDYTPHSCAMWGDKLTNADITAARNIPGIRHVGAGFDRNIPPTIAECPQVGAHFPGWKCVSKTGSSCPGFIAPKKPEYGEREGMCGNYDLTQASGSSLATMTKPANVQACKNACDANEDCDGFVAHPRPSSGPIDTPDYCEFYRGVRSLEGIKLAWRAHSCYAKAFDPAHQCTCQHGTPAAGKTDCPTGGAAKCKACPNPMFDLEGDSCIAKRCTCTGGTGEGCPVPGTPNHCVRCDDHYTLNGHACTRDAYTSTKYAGRERMCSTVGGNTPAIDVLPALKKPKSLYVCEATCEASSTCDAFLSHPFGLESSQTPIDYCLFYRNVQRVTDSGWRGHTCWAKAFAVNQCRLPKKAPAGYEFGSNARIAACQIGDCGSPIIHDISCVAGFTASKAGISVFECTAKHLDYVLSGCESTTASVSYKMVSNQDCHPTGVVARIPQEVWSDRSPVPATHANQICNVDKCKQECDSHSDCVGFFVRYVSWTSCCDFYTKFTGMYATPDHDCYVKDSPGSYTHHRNQHCVGTNPEFWADTTYTRHDNLLENVETCKALCTQHEDCLGFFYRYNVRCEFYVGIYGTTKIGQYFADNNSCYIKEITTITTTTTTTPVTTTTTTTTPATTTSPTAKRKIVGYTPGKIFVGKANRALLGGQPHGLAMSSDGNTIAMGAPGHYTAIYRRTSKTAEWTQLGEDIGKASSGSDTSGESVALSADGNTVCVGGLSYTHPQTQSSGIIRVFTFKNGGWVQKGGSLYGTDPSAYVGFTCTISEDGNVVAYGDQRYSRNSNQGRVIIYKFSGNSWVQKGGDLRGPRGHVQGGFDTQLSADGNMVVLSYRLMSSPTINQAGMVRVYRYSGSQWQQVGQDVFGPSAQSSFGYGVGISDDGSKFISSAGAVAVGRAFVYQLSGDRWNQVGETITPPRGYNHVNDCFGSSVSMSGDGNAVVVGAICPGNPAWSGRGYGAVYELTNGNYELRGEKLTIQADHNDYFGRAVATNTDGSTVIVCGAHYNNPPNSQAGHCRVYDGRTSSLEERVAIPASKIAVGVTGKASLATSERLKKANQALREAFTSLN